MKKEYLQILVKIGGVGKKERGDARKTNDSYTSGDFIGGITTHCVRKDSGERVYRVFLNGRQADSEFIDSFYHEMTHVLMNILRIRQDENHARWIGYLCKMFWWRKRASRLRP